jgi:OOP family OmpA-OmpF porin
MLRTTSLICLTVLAACGGGATEAPTPASVPPTSGTVDATPNITFNPSPLNIAAGGTATFAFGSVGHNVYFDGATGAPANIPGVNVNTSVTRMFPTAGTYVYTCHIHPGMTGRIVVSPAPTASDSGPTGYGSYNRS